MEEMLITE